MIEIRDLGLHVAALSYLKEIKDDPTADQFKKLTVLALVPQGNGQDIDYWAIENKAEYDLLKACVEQKDGAADLLDLNCIHKISFRHLERCPHTVFNPPSHRGYRYDLVKIIQDIRDKEEQTVKVIQKLPGRSNYKLENPLSPTKILDQIFAMDDEERQTCKDTPCEKFIARLLISLRFWNGISRQLSADLMGPNAPQNFFFFATTGVSAGCFVFLANLLTVLIPDIKEVCRGKQTLHNCLTNAFGPSGQLGIACAISSGIWQQLIDLSKDSSGRETSLAYLYTATGCAAAFFVSMSITQLMYRIAEERSLKSCSSFWSKDIGRFTGLTLNAGLSAAFLCGTYFEEFFGFNNPLYVEENLTSPLSYLRNCIKAGGLTWMAYWVTELIKFCIGKCRFKGIESNPTKLIMKLTKDFMEHVAPALEEPKRHSSMMTGGSHEENGHHAPAESHRVSHSSGDPTSDTPLLGHSNGNGYGNGIKKALL